MCCVLLKDFIERIAVRYSSRMLSFTLPPQPMNGGGGGSSVIGTNDLNSHEPNQQLQFSTMSVESNPSEGSMEFEDAMEQPAVPHNGQLGKHFHNN